MPNTRAANEADTNADTCCLGQNFLILHYTNRVADVYAYDKSLAPLHNVPIVTGATAYDCPITRRTYILVFHESLFYGTKLDHSLINPNQLRAYGVPFWDNPYDEQHDLCIQAPHADLNIPLQTKGTKVLFETRVPTQQDLQECVHVAMTSQREWNPATIAMKISAVQTQTPIPWKRTIEGVHHNVNVYFDPISDEALMDSMDTTLVNFNDSRTIQATTVHETEVMDDVPVRRTFVSTERHTKATAESLSERFGIGIQRARETLKATLQRGVRSAILPISRRYRADRMFMKKRLNGKFSSDTAYFKQKSLRGNVASQIFFHKCGFAANYHVSRVNNETIGPTLDAFINEFGVPEHLTVDGAPVQIGRHTRFQQTIRDNEVDVHISHPYSPQENPAEGGIREIKRRFYRLMEMYKIPMRLWDFVLDYTIETMRITVPRSRYAKKRTPLESITGITPDISEWLDFNIYDWCYFRTNGGLAQRELGRWLGVSHRVGQAMTYWILPKSGIPISCDTVQRVTNAERLTEETKRRMTEWGESTKPILNAKSSYIAPTELEKIPKHRIFHLEHEDQEFRDEFERVLKDTSFPDMDEVYKVGDISEPDPYINMELSLDRETGDRTTTETARVVRQKFDHDGKPMGKASHTPMLDTRQYEVEFPDGHIETFAANVLAENILAQVDDFGTRHLLLDEVIGHRIQKDAIPKSKGTYITKTGAKRKVRTTRGWEVCIRWKGGTTAWVVLKDIKDSFPVELAQYARDRGLLDEPVFAWWAPYTLKKTTRILSTIKSKYWERTHKFGQRVPRTIKEAREIDTTNGNTDWMDAVHLEMKNCRVAFEEHEGDVRDLVGYEEITGHIIFDIRMGENFRKKARYVADGHKTRTPSAVTYSTVVSRDSVRLMLLVAALNDLEVKGVDIQNAFLSAPNREKCYIVAGPEFGEDEGKVLIVRRALYGLKSASAAFRAYMADQLDTMGFHSSPADPDVWLRPAIKENGEKYYEYVLAYVDDILAISMKPDEVMAQIGERFKFKNNKVEPPTTYLGARLAQRKIKNRAIWTMTSDDYINAAEKNITDALKDTKWKIPTSVRGPMVSGFTPELDDSPELNDDDATLYRELIGILRWATEIGRTDILHEIAILSQYQAIPRQGHMEQVLHIFGYLKKKGKMTLYFDPHLPNIDYTKCRTNREEFQAQYRDAKEEMPYRRPEPRGLGVVMSAFCDASHGANKKTRRSHTGYLIFVNSAPILWYSKKQATVESSTFSAELIALRTCIEAATHLRYKLRMFGIPIVNDEPTHIFCDNESAVKNASVYESTLHKKHASLAYHYVRWNVAAGVCAVSWIKGSDNLADPYTKRLPEATREYLFGNWTY